MLIDFEVGNFLSIREPVRLSMAAATPIKEFEDENVFVVGKQRLLRSAAIYGANASGKSNLINAMLFMSGFVLTSSKDTQATDAIPTMPFMLDLEHAGQPSRFEVRFVLDDCAYRYGFEVDAKRVRAEWLFRTKKISESSMFVRKDDRIEIEKSFGEGSGIESKTRDNALFLSVVAQFNGPIATRILRWFSHVWPLNGLREQDYAKTTVQLLQHQSGKDLILGFLRKADLGIEDITVTETEVDNAALLALLSDEGKRVLQGSVRDAQSQLMASVHARYAEGRRVGTVALDFERSESAGTKKFFKFAGPLLGCLEIGCVVIADELDASLHPSLTLAIIRLFNSAVTNPKNAQLIFTTHDTSLLNYGEFRRDQIWFTEKSREEATDLYSLAEIKLPDGGKVRNDAALEKNYIAGRYGAIPFMGDFTELFGHGDHGKAD